MALFTHNGMLTVDQIIDPKTSPITANQKVYSTALISCVGEIVQIDDNTCGYKIWFIDTHTNVVRSFNELDKEDLKKGLTMLYQSDAYCELETHRFDLLRFMANGL